MISLGLEFGLLTLSYYPMGSFLPRATLPKWRALILNDIQKLNLRAELGNENCHIDLFKFFDLVPCIRARFFIHNSGMRMVGTECIRNILFMLPLGAE